MYSYQLENKSADKLFLEGHPIPCRAVLKPNEEISPGEVIVVMLSTGAKYKGIVKSFEPAVVGGHQMGDLEIQRY